MQRLYLHLLDKMYKMLGRCTVIFPLLVVSHTREDQGENKYNILERKFVSLLRDKFVNVN